MCYESLKKIYLLDAASPKGDREANLKKRPRTDLLLKKGLHWTYVCTINAPARLNGGYQNS